LTTGYARVIFSAWQNPSGNSVIGYADFAFAELTTSRSVAGLPWPPLQRALCVHSDERALLHGRSSAWRRKARSTDGIVDPTEFDDPPARLFVSPVHGRT